MTAALNNCIIKSGDDMKKYLRKNTSFDPDDKEEMELYQWLKSLDHGKFSDKTKAYWMKEMSKAKMKEDRNEHVL